MKKIILFAIVFLMQIVFVKIEAQHDHGNTNSHKSHSKEQKTEHTSEYTEEEREMKMSMALARLKKEAGDTAKVDTTIIKEEEEINKDCPIMGGAINKEINYEYKGKKYYFCCPSCIDEFKKDPEKYIKILKEKEEVGKNKEEQHTGHKADMDDTSMDSSHGGI